MTLEYLAEQKEKYQKKAEYFLSISFDNLANDFQKVIDLITEMENCIKDEGEDNNGENNEDQRAD